MTQNTVHTKTLKLRLKDKHAGFLREQARAINFVWNICNELSVKHFERKREFLSAYDMQTYTKGAGKELNLHSQSVQAVQEEYCLRRKQFKKVKLRWRVSDGSRRSLGWVPFKASALSYKNGQVWFCGKPLSLWDSYGLSKYELGASSLSEDARGRWYLNVTVQVVCKPEIRVPLSRAALGIDLGLKELLTDSEGQSVPAQKFYRDMQPKLAAAQRANKKKRVRAIHAKIANRRKDHLHKLSTQQVREHCAIFVGDVNAAGLAKTNMAKSVLDAGWSTYRTMLQYKCHQAGVWFKEVNESYSTQECHVCHQLTGPKGQQELDVRSWTCEHCGTEHSRDHNAAINIRERGLTWLEQQFEDTQVQRGQPHRILNKAFEPFGAKVAAGRGRLAGGILGL